MVSPLFVASLLIAIALLRTPMVFLLSVAALMLVVFLPPGLILVLLAISAIVLSVVGLLPSRFIRLVATMVISPLSLLRLAVLPDVKHSRWTGYSTGMDGNRSGQEKSFANSTSILLTLSFLPTYSFYSNLFSGSHFLDHILLGCRVFGSSFSLSDCCFDYS
jgi:hypothetical protein